METIIMGIPASPGIVIGKAFLIEPPSYNIKEYSIKDESLSNEIRRFENAIKNAKKDLTKLKLNVEKKLGKSHADIIESQLLILEDPHFISSVKDNLIEKKLNVEYILSMVVGEFVRSFNVIEDSYYKERVMDIYDIGKRVLKHLLGIQDTDISHISKNVILFTQELTPSDAIKLDRKHVKGVVSVLGSKTSHAAIIARTLKIPAVVGVKQILSKVTYDNEVIIDGNRGLVVINPKPETSSKFRKNRKQYYNFERRLKKQSALPVETTDGYRAKLTVNLDYPGNYDEIFSYNPDGIGLFRTEYLFINREQFPSEDEQFTHYKVLLEKFFPLPVVIRTIDLGGDKLGPAMEYDNSTNSFLGMRSIRLCLKKIDMFKTQLRALLRASLFGNLKIMFPMISHMSEIYRTKEIIKEVIVELDSKGQKYKNNIPLGIMIEVPSAVMISDLLAKEVDFFSIGTNDLIQYSIAVNREDEKVAHLYQPFHPGILRMIRRIIIAAQKENIPVSMCGEMASNIFATPLLLAMGLNEFSMNLNAIPEINKIIRSLNYYETQKILDKIWQFTTAADIERYMKSYVNKFLPQIIRN